MIYDDTSMLVWHYRPDDSGLLLLGMPPTSFCDPAVQALEHLRAPTTAMAKGLGSFSGGGSATLQRSKLNQSQKQVSREIKTDDGQGGGIGGKGIFNGGGRPLTRSPACAGRSDASCILSEPRRLLA